MSRTSQTSQDPGCWQARIPELKKKSQRIFRRGPSSSDGVQLFCTVPNFLQAVPTRGRQARWEIFPWKVAGRNCFNIISDSTVQLLLGEKVDNMDYFFPARRAVVRTHKYICSYIPGSPSFWPANFALAAVIQHWSLRLTWLWPERLVSRIYPRDRDSTIFFLRGFGSSRFYGLHWNHLMSQTSQTSPGSGVLTSQNPRILKIEDFLDGDPPLLIEFNCFVLYRTFYRLYQQEYGRQDVSREIFPGCSQAGIVSILFLAVR